MSAEIYDERRGLPSCSALDRLANCPGSFKLAKEAQRQGVSPPSDPWTTTGQKIHRALETDDAADYAALTHDEAETAAICEAQRHRLTGEWMLPDGGNLEHFKERRLGMTRFGLVLDVTPQNTGIDFVVTGMADHIVIDQPARRGLVMDYKALPGQVDPARSNAQLRGLAVLAAGFWSLEHVRVAIIQPLAGPPTVADYDAESLHNASIWLEAVCEEVHRPHEPHAGDWCKYCPAQLICPALKAGALAPLSFIQPATLPPEKTKEAIFARVHDFGGDDIAALLKDPRLKMAGMLTAAAKKVATEMLLADPGSVPGFELRDRKGHRKITDADAASKALGQALAGAEGGATAALLRSAVLSPKLLTEELCRASGPKLKKDGAPAKTGYNLTGMAAKEKLAETLGGLMVQPVKKALARVGELLEFDREDEE
jgi:hypothetical protein